MAGKNKRAQQTIASLASQPVEKVTASQAIRDMFIASCMTGHVFYLALVVIAVVYFFTANCQSITTISTNVADKLLTHNWAGYAISGMLFFLLVFSNMRIGKMKKQVRQLKKRIKNAE